MKEKEQLVSVSLIQSTSGVVVDFSPELQCADQLFEDVRLFLELYEEEDGYRVCLDKEELLKFIKQQTTLPLLPVVPEEYLLPLLEVAWNIVLNALERELTEEYLLLEQLLSEQAFTQEEEQKALATLQQRARTIIADQCLEQIAQEVAKRLQTEAVKEAKQKKQARGKQPRQLDLGYL